MERNSNSFIFFLVYLGYGVFLYFGPFTFTLWTYLYFLIMQTFYHRLLAYSPWLYTSVFSIGLLFYFYLAYHFTFIIDTTLTHREILEWWGNYFFYGFIFSFHSRKIIMFRQQKIREIWEKPLTKKNQDFKDMFTRAHRFYNDWRD